MAEALKRGLALVGEGCCCSGLTGVAAVAIGGATLHSTLGARPETVGQGGDAFSFTDWQAALDRWTDERVKAMAARNSVWYINKEFSQNQITAFFNLASNYPCATRCTFRLPGVLLPVIL